MFKKSNNSYLRGENKMFNQTEFKGYDVKKMEKDFKKLTKKYMKMGNNIEAAEEKAKWFIDYYKHTYRVFA
jgi:hypothetical protein